MEHTSTRNRNLVPRALQVSSAPPPAILRCSGMHGPTPTRFDRGAPLARSNEAHRHVQPPLQPFAVKPAYGAERRESCGLECLRRGSLPSELHGLKLAPRRGLAPWLRRWTAKRVDGEQPDLVAQCVRRRNLGAGVVHYAAFPRDEAQRGVLHVSCARSMHRQQVRR